VRSSPDPWDSWEFCTLQYTTHNSRWMRIVVRMGFGWLALMSAVVSAEAQTYYYYPTSVPTAPAYTTGTTVAPTYYRRGLFGNRLVWTWSSPQYTQPQYSTQSYSSAYTPQYYQATQTQATQPTESVKVDPVSYKPKEPVVADPAPAAVAETAPVAAAEAAPVAAPEAGDPYGFTVWLNATRAAYGLPAVGHDPNLSSWAAVNNSHQAARGIGHFVMGPARRQNSAMGAFANIGSMWMASPAHRAALLDPTIRWIGIAGLGAYWTFNAN
jgi:uncharacterized protein YkwD